MKNTLFKIVSVLLCFCMFASCAVFAGAEGEGNAITGTVINAIKGVLGEDVDLSKVEEILNSEVTEEIINGAMSADGVVDITQIVINLIARFNKDDLIDYGKETAIELEQKLINALAGIIKGVYDNKDLIIKFDQTVFFDWLGMQNEDDWKDPEGPDAINPENVYYMDVDGDGRVTSRDARAILRASARLEEFTREQIDRADVDGDGRITAADARLALRYSAHLIFSRDLPIFQ